MDNAEKARLEAFKQNQGLYCIDWTDETINIYGTKSSGNSAQIDVKILPCHISTLYFGLEEDGIPENCNRNKTELAKYLGNMYNIVTYFNQ